MVAMRRQLSAARIGLLAAAAVAAVVQAEVVHNASCLGEVFKAMGFTDEQPLPKDASRCKEYARGLPFEPEYVAALKQHSRPLPPREPPLAAHDWDMGMMAQRPPAWPDLPAGSCIFHPNYELTRVKLYNGVLYAHHPNDDNSTVGRWGWRVFREGMFNLMLLATWLYKDMPDVEFAINYYDHPQPCNLSFPVLQFSVFNMTSPSSGSNLDVSPHRYPCGGTDYHIAKDCPGYTKGFTMPTPTAMWFSLSPRQTWALSFCWHASYIRSAQHPLHACGVPRKAKAFWRGSASGMVTGWSVRKQDDVRRRYNSGSEASWMYGALLNKRLRMVLMAGVWPWMDVGLTDLRVNEFHGFHAHQENAFIKAALLNITSADFVPLHSASAYHLLLNLDGAGPAYRLPELMLYNAPVLKVESILREWFIDAAVPGVHYLPTRFDLSDIGHDTRVLLEEAQQDSSRLEKMAVAAAALAVDHMNLLGQVETTAWSMARIKEVCQWEVLPPQGAVSLRPGADVSRAEAGWHVVKLNQPMLWPRLPQEAKESIMAQLHHNLIIT